MRKISAEGGLGYGSREFSFVGSIASLRQGFMFLEVEVIAIMVRFNTVQGRSKGACCLRNQALFPIFFSVLIIEETIEKASSQPTSRLTTKPDDAYFLV